MALLMALLLCSCGIAFSEEKETTGDASMLKSFNNVPDEVRAIKYDPFVSPRDDFSGSNQNATVPEKVAFWKEQGFDTIYLIGFHRGGGICFPARDTHLKYDKNMYGEDFLRDLTAECEKQGMCLFVGSWTFRDDALYSSKPEWRQKMSGGMYTDEKLLCPFSPYLEEAFYPIYQQMYDEYGIANFFFQEMWFNWDGLGRSSSLSSYSIDAFNQYTGGNWSIDKVQDLEIAIAIDEEVTRQWYQMHFDKEVEIINRLKSIGNGTIAWHNLREAEYPLVMAAPEKLEGVFINAMALYPEIQIWDAKSTDDVDPFLTYRWCRNFTNKIQGFRSVMEYYSLYGYSGVTQPLERQDWINVYLAVRAGGIRETVAEQDAFIIRMNQWKEGAWEAIAESYRVYDPIFEGAEFIGASRSAVWADGKESTNGNRRILTSWVKGDTEIIIAGLSTYKKPVDMNLLAEGKTVTDEAGNIIEERSFTLQSGEMRVFIVK